MTSPKIVVITKLACIQAKMTTMTGVTEICKSNEIFKGICKVSAKTAAIL
jgi:hypothetical protein